MWYVIGILAGRLLVVPPGGLFLLAGVLLSLALIGRRELSWPLPGLLLAMGWLNVTLATAVLSPLDLRHTQDGAPELVWVRARLARDPVLRLDTRAGEERWRSQVLVRVEAIKQRGRWQPAQGPVLARVPTRLPDAYHAGQGVEIYGILRPPALPIAEGLFDYRQHLRWQGIHFELITQDLRDWRLLGDPRAMAGLAHRFQNWARRTLSHGLPEDQQVRLLWAMVLGWRTALTDEVAEPFMQSGTMHLFAISGLHVALLAGMLVTLLRVLQVPRAGGALIVIPLLWFYAMVTGWQASAVRATIMMNVVILGWSLRRPPDLLNSLCAAALVILFGAPLQLFRASFQLSFFVVLTMALLLPVLEQFRQRILSPDPMLPPELLTAKQRMLRAVGRWGLGSFAVSLAAWLGSWPLIAHYFHLVTPASLLVNVLMVPLGAMVLTSALGSLVTGAWALPLAECFNHAAWLGMTGMVHLSETAAAAPGAWWYVASPGWWRILLFYGVLTAFVGGQCWRAERRRWLPWLMGLPLLALGGAAWWNRDLVRITVLSPDGEGIVRVDAPGRRADLLVDCGGDRTVTRLTLPLLAAQGVNRLPTLVLTHGDIRHVGGAGLLAESIPIDVVSTSGLKFRSPGYNQFLANLTNEPSARQIVFRGDQVAGWDVLYPEPGDQFARADDKTLVLARTIHEIRILLLSDLAASGQARLQQSGQGLEAELVVAGMPLNEQPLSPELLAAIAPRVVVLADTEWPPSQQAPSALCARIEKTGATVLRISQEGSVTVEVRPSGWEVRSRRGTTLRFHAPP